MNQIKSYNVQGFDFIPPNREWLEPKIVELEQVSLELSVSIRNKRIQALLDSYFRRFGKVPDSDHLHRLANVIMADELRSKVRRSGGSEILSEQQLYRRITGKSLRKGIQAGEAPFILAATYATDGKNYALPIRRFQ